MRTTPDAAFTGFSTRKLKQLLGRIRDCVARLEEDQIWSRDSENQNAIGNLLLHLNGNVNQWILSAVGGRPDTRRRDAEFEARGGASKTELLARLESTVNDACAIIDGLDEAGLMREVHVQKFDLPALEAVYHVVEHFALHAGQIMFATKMLTGADLEFYKYLKTADRGETTP